MLVTHFGLPYMTNPSHRVGRIQCTPCFGFNIRIEFEYLECSLPVRCSFSALHVTTNDTRTCTAPSCRSQQTRSRKSSHISTPSAQGSLSATLSLHIRVESPKSFFVSTALSEMPLVRHLDPDQLIEKIRSNDPKAHHCRVCDRNSNSDLTPYSSRYNSRHAISKYHSQQQGAPVGDFSASLPVNR